MVASGVSGCDGKRGLVACVLQRKSSPAPRCGLSRPAANVGMDKLSEDAEKIDAHRELRAAAKKSKTARILKKALAKSIAFSADPDPPAAATESSTPRAPHPD